MKKAFEVKKKKHFPQFRECSLLDLKTQTSKNVVDTTNLQALF